MQNTLRVRRAERRVSQRRVATESRIAYDRYWRIENGYTDPEPAERARLAAFFSVAELVLFPTEQGAHA
jgi:transcriptional regulator with XRE-family HTH domain